MKSRTKMPRKSLAETKQVAFRLPEDLVARLDDHAATMMSEHPGLDVTRTDVVRVLLTRALDAEVPTTTPRRS